MTEHVCEKIVKLQDELEGRPIARGTKLAGSTYIPNFIIYWPCTVTVLPAASTNPLHLAWNPPERPESINILFGKNTFIAMLLLLWSFCIVPPHPRLSFSKHVLTNYLDSLLIRSFVQGLEEYEIDDDIRRAKGQYMLRDWAESSSDDDDS